MSNFQPVNCPICQAKSQLFTRVRDTQYFECFQCDFIFADPDVLKRLDAGEPIRPYDASYWKSELASARERAYGPALARVAEALLYARKPVMRFIDIYGGPGYLLDAITRYLPQAADRFVSVELFPPSPELRTKHPNYFIGSLGSVRGSFQAGLCMEVVEHLTPAMVKKLAFDLAAVSDPEACYLFNTGLTTYVKAEDPAYVDPYVRGHVTIWSVSAARKIFEPAGFTVYPIRGKTWCFLAEYQSRTENLDWVNERVWSAHPSNKALLADPSNGSLMYVLGIETSRTR